MRLIDADELKKKIEEVQYTQEFCIEHQIDYSISMQMLGMIIDNAPTVEIGEDGIDIEKYSDRLYKIAYEKGKAEAERPTGEWIAITQRISDSKTSTHWECSICHEPDRKNGKSKFCCECGAKMKEPQTQKFADTDTAYGGLASAT